MIPFPSDDPFAALDASRRDWDDLFALRLRRGVGRGGVAARPKADSDAAEEEPAEAFAPEEQGPADDGPAKPEARLFNPAWGAEQGYFNETVRASIEGDLPPESSHLTRVTFTLRAIKDGQSEVVGTKEAHLEGGRAEAEFDLWIPQFRDEAGNLVQECEYVFAARHRDSAEIESQPLIGKPRSQGLPPDAAAPTTIEVVLLQEGNLPRAEEKYVLTDAAGTVFQGVTDKDGRVRVEDAAPGEATIRFPALEALAAATTRVAAGAGGLSSFYLRIQMDPEAAKELEETFTLKSADGSFTQARTADDDLILGDNFIDLRFTGLPIDKAYTLTVEGRGKPPYDVFRDVPFLKLDGFVGQGGA